MCSYTNNNTHTQKSLTHRVATQPLVTGIVYPQTRDSQETMHVRADGMVAGIWERKWSYCYCLLY